MYSHRKPSVCSALEYTLCPDTLHRGLLSDTIPSEMWIPRVGFGWLEHWRATLRRSSVDCPHFVSDMLVTVYCHETLMRASQNYVFVLINLMGGIQRNQRYLDIPCVDHQITSTQTKSFGADLAKHCQWRMLELSETARKNFIYS